MTLTRIWVHIFRFALVFACVPVARAFEHSEPVATQSLFLELGLTTETLAGSGFESSGMPALIDAFTEHQSHIALLDSSRATYRELLQQRNAMPVSGDVSAQGQLADQINTARDAYLLQVDQVRQAVIGSAMTPPVREFFERSLRPGAQMLPVEYRFLAWTDGEMSDLQASFNQLQSGELESTNASPELSAAEQNEITHLVRARVQSHSGAIAASILQLPVDR